MTSVGIFASRLTRIDDLTRPDHHYLTADDACYYFGEYTARAGFAYSETNQLIINLKKPMDRHGLPEWRYKETAIQDASRAFRKLVHPRAIESVTFVPVPPSKTRDHPLHDDRLTRILLSVQREPPLDVRELIVQIRSTEAVHDHSVRPGPAEIQALYRIDETLCVPAPRTIAIVDDLLTTGAHFRAASSLLSNRFPDRRIVGLFIARRVPRSVDL